MATASTTTSSNGHDVTRKAVSKTKRTSHAAARKAKQTADGLDARISHFAEDAGHRVSSLYNSGLSHAEDAATETRHFVQEKPLSALAGAFFGGLLLATLLRR